MTGGSSGRRGIFAYDKAGVAEFASLIFRSRLAVLGADPARVSQTPRGVAVLALVERGTSLAGLRESLGAALRTAGLADPEVQVEAVDSLPRHPETGKLRRVVPA